ncbi:lysis protein [Escherichia coli]|nr:lysis protein [Escherichia coli]
MNKILMAVVGLLLVACGALWFATNHYRDNAIAYKEQRDNTAEKLSLANATITDLQQRQRDVAALDAKYTKELADARAENETLRADVAAGRRSLRVSATCPGPVRETTSAARVDNAARPGLTDAAKRDYFTLRERIVTMRNQLEGAQEYIRTQCLK